MLAIRKIVSFQGASQRAVLYSLLSGCGISGLRTLTNSASGRRSLYIAAITCSNGKSNKPKSSQSNEHESVFMQVLGKKEQPKQMTVGVKGSRISIILMLLLLDVTILLLFLSCSCSGREGLLLFDSHLCWFRTDWVSILFSG